MTKKIKKKEPLPRAPALNIVNVIQFQLFDNGPKPGTGRSQHQMGMEFYVDGRLDLLNPYWSRVVRLINPKDLLDWADTALAGGRITTDQHAVYANAYGAAEVFMQGEDSEWAKMGHIGSKQDGNVIYENQFILVTKVEKGPITCVVFIDGEMVGTDSFQFNKRWKPGVKARKFVGFYDPNDMYARMKAEREMETRAAALAAARGASL